MKNVNIENMSIATHNNVPVVTTDLLATLYGTEPDYIRKNHNRNLGRFEVGKHYFLLEGEELREFKHRMSLRPSVENNKVTKCYSVKVAKNVRSLILWTERGAARHAKMLETDQAWDVFEKLEDHYFNSGPIKSNEIAELQPSPIMVTIPTEGRWLVAYRNGKHQVINIDGHNVVNVEYIQKLQRDSNLLIELLQNYRQRTQVLQGDKSGDILNSPLVCHQ
ncbi:ORF6N domain-containing protein [Providencia stuartii]